MFSDQLEWMDGACAYTVEAGCDCKDCVDSVKRPKLVSASSYG